MTEWLVVSHPASDPNHVHVVPGVKGKPDPIHDASPDCGCKPRMGVEIDLLGRRHVFVIHAGPN